MTFPPSIMVMDTGTARGRAVYSTHEFQTNEIVEESPVVLVRFNEIPKEVKLIVFDWEGLSSGRGVGSAIALGYGSLYNHENPANMRYEADVPLKLIRFIAVRHLAIGAELTINYSSSHGEAESDSNHWFEQMSIKPFPGGGL